MTKEIIKNLDFLKIQKFCVVNNIIKKMGRQLIEWGKVFACDAQRNAFLNMQQALTNHKKKGNNAMGKWSTWMTREFNFLKELQITLKTM